MKRLRFCALAIGLSALVVSPANSSFGQTAPPIATATAAPANSELSPRAAEVMRMAKAGVSDEVLLTYVRNSPGAFSLSSADVLELKDAGVPSPVISAMLTHSASGTSATVQKVSAASVQLPPTAPTTQADGASASTAAAKRLQRAPVVVEQAPPSPRLEIVPLPPGPDYAWVPGHWLYRGGKWYWVGGLWKLQPYRNAVWVDGHWAHHGRGWIWVHGHWH